MNGLFKYSEERNEIHKFSTFLYIVLTQEEKFVNSIKFA